MEYVDILNENGIMTGEVKLKKEAHEKGLWHKAVHIFIINKVGKLLIQKRSSNKDFYPDVWDVSAAGHISAGENSLISGIRETEEEIGLNITEEEMRFIFSIREQHEFRGIKNNEFLDVYWVQKDFDFNTLVMQKEEVGDIKLIDIDEFEMMVNNRDESLFPHYGEFKMFIDLYKKNM